MFFTYRKWVEPVKNSAEKHTEYGCKQENEKRPARYIHRIR